jgi:hypothetical protein
MGSLHFSVKSEESLSWKRVHITDSHNGLSLCPIPNYWDITTVSKFYSVDEGRI